MRNSEYMDMTKFEFLLSMGNNIICQRYFMVRSHIPKSLKSVDLYEVIKEISDDRTELRVTTNELSYDALSTSYFNYINSKTNKSFYSDFLFSFGVNTPVLISKLPSPYFLFIVSINCFSSF